jgi:protein TonB
MFDRYMGARQEKRSKVFRLILIVSGILHGIGFVAAIIWSFWKIDRLTVKDSSVLYMAAAMSSPPPPPPPPPPPKKSSTKTEVKQIKPTEIIQPPKEIKELPKAQEESSEDDGEEGGVEGGEKGGVVGGVIGGVVGGEIGGELGGELGVPVPPPAAPTAVPQQLLEGSRIGGQKIINLTAPMLTTLKNQGLPKLTVKVKMCLDENGSPSSVDVTKGSGYPDIDALISSTMRSTWRFKPTVVAGKAVKVCTPFIFNYQIQ